MYIHLYVKLGDVPDKLCIFPADESYEKLETALSRDHWLVWPHNDSIFMDTCICMYMVYMYMYNHR